MASRNKNPNADPPEQPEVSVVDRQHAAVLLKRIADALGVTVAELSSDAKPPSAPRKDRQ